MTDGAPRRWVTYLGERSPLPLLLVIAIGQSLSGNYLFRRGFQLWPIAGAAVGLATLLFLLRLMDEIKDLAKDRVAHPERPLPRGLLDPAEVRRAIVRIGLILGAYGLVLSLGNRWTAGAAYSFTVGYAFLMYREFFAPRALNRNAFLYALSHQLIVIPMYAFAVAMSSPPDLFTVRTLWFSLTGLAASFLVEIARKLDPAAKPILGTYLQLYGRGPVVATMVLSLILLLVSTRQIGVERIVWPFAAVFAATIPVLYLRSGAFRIVESAAALLALVQMLAPTLRYTWGALA